VNLVIDASASVRAAIGGDHAPAILDALETADWVATSALHGAEAGNALWKYARAGRLAAADAAMLLSAITASVDEVVPVSENLDEALAEAIRLSHPVYDLLYLTLARRRGATLVTVDARLAALAEAAGIAVAPLGPDPDRPDPDPGQTAP
jgi:predicted nucleic acid-binding protein